MPPVEPKVSIIFKDTGVTVIENPRNLRYSKTSVDSVSFGRPRDLAIDQGEAAGVTIEMRNRLVSPEPFQNFLQVISLNRGTKPEDNIQEANAKWALMTPTEKEAYTAGNYFQRLINEANRDAVRPVQGNLFEELLNGITIPGIEGKSEKVQEEPTPKVQKTVKRLATTARGVSRTETKKNEKSEESAKPRRTNSSYKNFLREYKRNSPGTLSVECASLWRKMTDLEKAPYRIASSTRLKKPFQKINQKKVIKPKAPSYQPQNQDADVNALNSLLADSVDQKLQQQQHQHQQQMLLMEPP
ncbi:uncharacterized protein LOC108112411 [Drosophila eugracilis]|uniref:uncharacterized protein LOC108112411 n=1 Tax=Drosophila eugracilis TaxID=29029 RepID=UPI001BDB414C|nr:uncharacterized protein LOC108112411 [Drosophila eugracilis]